MASSLTVVTQPAAPLVSLTEAKAALLVDHRADDVLITALVAAATMEAQQRAARAFVTQTLSLALDAWPDDNVIRLWWPPVQSVTHIKYYDADNALQTVATTDYVAILDVCPAIVVPAPGKSWPSSSLRDHSPIRVQYVAGYGAAAAVVTAEPELVQLVKALVMVDYEHRDQLSSQAAAQRERILNALAGKWGWAG